MKLSEPGCHFCNAETYIGKVFEYLDIHTSDKKWVPVCSTHFDELCNSTYSNDTLTYLPHSQREYIAIKRLEKQLDVSSTIKIK